MGTMRLFVCFCLAATVAGCGARTPLDPNPDGGPDGTVPPDASVCDRDRDGFLAPSCGGVDCNDFEATINPGASEVCGDLQDNDCDGRLDCADSECASSPGCGVCTGDPRLMERCDNGVDDNADCLTDCEDPGCFGHPFCGGGCEPRPEDCFNGRDDDCNGLIDCEDFSCREFPECFECRPGPEDCFNGLDDDCDGIFDCDEPECRDVCAMCTPRPEECFNGRDDDCDRRVDCDDSDCRFLPECGGCEPRPEACLNGVDDDCDGLIDCDDEECRFLPECGECTPTGRERCDNGLDDDCDGRIDCGDTACARTMECAEACPSLEAGSRVGPAVRIGSTVGTPNLQAGSCGGAEASEHSVRWVAPRDGAYQFDTLGSGYDTLLYVRFDCFGPELACNDDDPRGGGNHSLVTVMVPAGAELIIFVDGWGMSSGSFVLNVTEVLASDEIGMACFDGLDNDGDGFIDCDDFGCSREPGCEMMCVPRPERCDNGRDDDCDGLVDCADRECRRAPGCGGTCTARELGVGACTNGVDDDCDGRADCDDPDCRPFGMDGECCDGVDDDGDGEVDLFTCRCFSDALCATVGSLEQICWESTFSVCAPRCDFYGGDSFCEELFDGGWTCVGGECLPP